MDHITDQSGAQIGSYLDRSYHTVYTALNTTVFPHFIEGETEIRRVIGLIKVIQLETSFTESRPWK